MIEKRLSEIQRTLKAPKGQFNKFGNYKYRSCEDIVEAVKSILNDEESIILNDDIVEVGGRIYVKATAIFTNANSSFKATGFAREPEIKKGMDVSQITGAASSYARKYALNGLFAIDDTKDADSQDNRESIKDGPATPKTKAQYFTALKVLFGDEVPAEKIEEAKSMSQSKMLAAIKSVRNC